MNMFFSCFFDVKKCFDTIDHQILLQKLMLYGIKGRAMDWFSNYLHNRMQFVKANNEKSELMPTSTGIPQGSALGPFLFLVFINDMPQHIHKSRCNMFADDNVLYTSGLSFINTKNDLQESIDEASKWYRNNHLPVNTVKTVSMISASSRKIRELQEQNVSLDLKLNEASLKQVPECLYLGLCLDSSLNWNSQVQKICKSVYYKLFVLNKLRKYMGRNLLSKIYVTNIKPCIEYGISIWGHCSENNRMVIRRLQHRAARIVMGNFDYINVRGHDLVQQLGWQTIEQRRDYFIATLMHRCINETAPTHLVNELIMTVDTHDISTRAAFNGTIQIPEPNKDIFKHTFRYQGALLWNNLPPELRGITDINVFKYMYKCLYF